MKGGRGLAGAVSLLLVCLNERVDSSLRPDRLPVGDSEAARASRDTHTNDVQWDNSEKHRRRITPFPSLRATQGHEATPRVDERSGKCKLKAFERIIKFHKIHLCYFIN